jgi:hypothetical protein
MLDVDVDALQAQLLHMKHAVSGGAGSKRHGAVG